MVVCEEEPRHDLVSVAGDALPGAVVLLRDPPHLALAPGLVASVRVAATPRAVGVGREVEVDEGPPHIGYLVTTVQCVGHFPHLDAPQRRKGHRGAEEDGDEQAHERLLGHVLAHALSPQLILVVYRVDNRAGEGTAKRIVGAAVHGAHVACRARRCGRTRAQPSSEGGCWQMRQGLSVSTDFFRRVSRQTTRHESHNFC